VGEAYRKERKEILAVELSVGGGVWGGGGGGPPKIFGGYNRGWSWGGGGFCLGGGRGGVGGDVEGDGVLVGGLGRSGVLSALGCELVGQEEVSDGFALLVFL